MITQLMNDRAHIKISKKTIIQKLRMKCAQMPACVFIYSFQTPVEYTTSLLSTFTTVVGIY